MPTRYYALLIGIAFVLAGIGGFLPFITQAPTTDAPALTVELSYGYLLGLFPINLVHNIFHFSAGLFGIWAYRDYVLARKYCQAMSIILIVLTIMGLVPFTQTSFGFMPVYGHDIWLHALEALVAAYLGFFWHDKVEGQVV